ncbi:aminotransferase class I/II-fold pyridoxal phosphate-dependent enzyme [Flavobacteriaceae bacterium F89]|uniref:Aminotransferase class I/II-fold pyridoxal phosphate-dependent enzyme n=1 Tax=Cerina litoralis TaxID=2874477 RepID=A0AAE3EXF1_9FLAO|nr:aminotransferase class I/II-fold pyridoxal phosphate-dependent enzyme [Cerina litoralis]MCG2462250.1 aminotransferase class I/II-fold pyridoxal phosphate-dependent enzyme [Cerina litoralis]
MAASPYYIDTFPGREISLNGKKYLYFGGTSYLGLQALERFQRIFIRNIKKYGTCYGASRKSNVRFSIFAKGENKLADLIGSEACITLSSGYLAGQMACKSFNKEEYQLFYAPHTHPALALSYSKDYATYTALNSAIRDHLTSSKTTTPVVFIDTINFSCSHYPNFKNLRSLPISDLILVADDSHGLGILGQYGGGCHAALSHLAPKELVVCGSLGKGWGIQGGAIFGSKRRIAQYMDTDIFAGASPTSPASIATFLEAQTIYMEQRASLKKRIEQFKSNLRTPKSFLHLEGHPAFNYTNNDLTDYLETNRIIVTNFPYPTGDASLISRIVLSAHHTENDIERLTSLINSF